MMKKDQNSLHTFTTLINKSVSSSTKTCGGKCVVDMLGNANMIASITAWIFYHKKKYATHQVTQMSHKYGHRKLSLELEYQLCISDELLQTLCQTATLSKVTID
jgi:hypothetical protein